MWRRAIPRVLQIIGLLSIAGAVAAAVTFFLLADLLQVDEPIERADYILPLAGDRHRVIRAAELYREDVAPVVLWSREYTPPRSRLQNLLVEMGYSLAEPKDFVPRLLEHLGVPSRAVEPFGDGHISTVEEAEALRRHLGNRNLTIVLVTSPYHTRRAKMIFERTMPNVRWIATSTPEGRIPARWWTDRNAALLVVPEVAKLVHYWFGGAFRAVPLRQ